MRTSLKTFLIIGFVSLLVGCESYSPIVGQRYGVNQLKNEYGLDYFFHFEYSSQPSEEHSMVFVMVDSSNYEYRFMFAKNVTGGWESSRIRISDSTKVIEDSLEVITIEYFSFEYKSDFSEYSFVLMNDFTILFKPDQDIELSYGTEHDYSEIITLESTPIDSISGEVFGAWKIDGAELVPLGCDTIYRVEKTIYCGNG